MFICTHTGVTRPECCCTHCLTEQIREFKPDLLQADPVGPIRVTDASASRQRSARRATR